MLNSNIWTYATCFVGKVCGPLWSTWGAPLGEGKFGAKAGIVNTKVVRRANTPPVACSQMSARVRVLMRSAQLLTNFFWLQELRG